MSTPNPFRAGFALRPSVLAGRDEVLVSADEALATAARDGYTPPPLMLVGHRGVGKTVLLAEVVLRAGTGYGWPALPYVVAGPRPLSAALSAGAAAVHDLITQAPPGGRYRVDQAVVRAGVAGVGADVRLKRQPEKSPALTLEAAFTRLARAAAERQTGFVVTVDELQVVPHEELAEFAALLQYGTLHEWPMVVVCAGLPSLRGLSTTGTGTEPSLGYMERANWQELGLLGLTDTLAALKGPAAQAGRPMDNGAAQLLARAAGGYPFAIQVYGKHAWRAAGERRRITPAAAKAAIGPASAELDRGLYATRWARIPQREREYLRSMAELVETGRPVTGTAIASRLRITTRAAAQYRARLISRGTLVANGAVLDFAVPGMASYVLRQPIEPVIGRSRSHKVAQVATGAGPQTKARSRARPGPQLER